MNLKENGTEIVKREEKEKENANAWNLVQRIRQKEQVLCRRSIRETQLMEGEARKAGSKVVDIYDMNRGGRLEFEGNRIHDFHQYLAV